MVVTVLLLLILSQHPPSVYASQCPKGKFYDDRIPACKSCYLICDPRFGDSGRCQKHASQCATTAAPTRSAKPTLSTVFQSSTRTEFVSQIAVPPAFLGHPMSYTVFQPQAPAEIVAQESNATLSASSNLSTEQTNTNGRREEPVSVETIIVILSSSFCLIVVVAIVIGIVMMRRRRLSKLVRAVHPEEEGKVQIHIGNSTPPRVFDASRNVLTTSTGGMFRMSGLSPGNNIEYQAFVNGFANPNRSSYLIHPWEKSVSAHLWSMD